MEFLKDQELEYLLVVKHNQFGKQDLNLNGKKLKKMRKIALLLIK
jgi:hypothetical protein